jgi:hypothetical protein
VPLDVVFQELPFALQLVHNVHTATQSDWERLQYALQNTPGIENLDLTVYLNQGGEYSYYGWHDVLGMIANGGVWIDWTGWPFAVTNLTGAIGNFPANFQNLAESMGLALGYNGGDASFSAVPPGWPYVRSLVTTGPVQGKNFIINHAADNTIYGNNYVYSSFAIRYQKGAYIYAFANGRSYDTANPLAVNTPSGVPFSQYWPFIEQVLRDIASYPSTSTSAPVCPNLGTYKGTNQNGEYIYVLQQGDKTITSLSIGNCTALSQTVTYSSTGTVTGTVYGNGSGSGGGSSNKNCPTLGQYLGDGSVVGANPKYNAYILYGSDYYIYNLALPGSCTASYFFRHTGSPVHSGGVPSGGTASLPPSSGSGSSGSSSAPSGGGSSSPKPPTSSGFQLTTQNALLIGGGLAAVGLAYFWYKRRHG